MTARYDEIYSTLARRAVRQAVVDLETFAERAVVSGLSAGRLEEMLLRDLDSGGPIFGKFVRSLTGAASSSVIAAEAQGEEVVRAYGEKLLSMSEMDDILESADAEEMQRSSENLSRLRMYTWVATLKNTCHLCLPLHGKSATRESWEEAGLDPRSIHQNEGWESKCQCTLMPSDEIDDPSSVRDPLRREPIVSPTGQKISGRTRRAVSKWDFTKAQQARDEAMQSEIGRRTMRLMGQINQGDE